MRITGWNDRGRYPATHCGSRHSGRAGDHRRLCDRGRSCEAVTKKTSRQRLDSRCPRAALRRKVLVVFFLEPRAEANMLPSSEPPSSRITPSPASSLILLLSLLSNDFATCLQPGSLTNCYSLKEEIKKMDPYDLKKLESLTAPRASCSGCRCATCSQVRLIYRTEEPSHSSNLYHTHFFNLSYYLILLAQM